jgi:hypothetical protein
MLHSVTERVLLQDNYAILLSRTSKQPWEVNIDHET